MQTNRLVRDPMGSHKPSFDKVVALVAKASNIDEKQLRDFESDTVPQGVIDAQDALIHDLQTTLNMDERAIMDKLGCIRTRITSARNRVADCDDAVLTIIRRQANIDANPGSSPRSKIMWPSDPEQRMRILMAEATACFKQPRGWAKVRDYDHKIAAMKQVVLLVAEHLGIARKISGEPMNLRISEVGERLKEMRKPLQDPQKPHRGYVVQLCAATGIEPADVFAKCE